jgi:hypothetical protein
MPGLPQSALEQEPRALVSEQASDYVLSPFSPEHQSEASLLLLLLSFPASSLPGRLAP